VDDLRLKKRGNTRESLGGETVHMEGRRGGQEGEWRYLQEWWVKLGGGEATQENETGGQGKTSVTLLH